MPFSSSVPQCRYPLFLHLSHLPSSKPISPFIVSLGRPSAYHTYTGGANVSSEDTVPKEPLLTGEVKEENSKALTSKTKNSLINWKISFDDALLSAFLLNSHSLTSLSRLQSSIMVSALPKFLPKTTDSTLKLRSRYYGSGARRAVSKVIYAQTNASGRNPRLDLLMGGKLLQPHIHDGVVAVLYKGRTFRFHLFVKNHCALPINKSVRRWKNCLWKGDIVVFKKGLSQELVNFSDRDAPLADFAVKSFLHTVAQKRRFIIPKNLVFVKR